MEIPPSKAHPQRHFSLMSPPPSTAAPLPIVFSIFKNVSVSCFVYCVCGPGGTLFIVCVDRVGVWRLEDILWELNLPFCHVAPPGIKLRYSGFAARPPACSAISLARSVQLQIGQWIK